MKDITAVRIGGLTWLTLVALLPSVGQAQLAECGQIDESNLVVEAGGCINRTLLDQIGAGHGHEFKSGSAVYLIKRDPARSIRRGRQLFQRKFTAFEGLGPRVNFTSMGDVTVSRAFGAGLSDSCAACHGRPRGSAGHGGDVATFPDSRDAPHLFGLGLVEMLADEVTADLRAIEKDVKARVNDPHSTQLSDNSRFGSFFRSRNKKDRRGRSRGGERRNSDGSITTPMVSKGIDFGEITVFSDGRVDSSGLKGVDADLRVKPFFHEGRSFSIREFIIGGFNDEMGLQASDPILCAVTDPVNPVSMVTPAGLVLDPALDEFNRPPVCNPTDDPDFDGVPNEIDPALVDHLEFYLLNYFKPGQYQVTNRARRGQGIMESIGCMRCHTQNLVVDNDRRIADVETNYDRERGIFNDLFAVATPSFEVVDDGQAYPQLLPSEGEFFVRNIFTDLKRHDLGAEFWERDFDGSRITAHMTEPLWGVGTSGPYGHDGRSVTLDAVIRRHGGEATRVTDAYRRLDDNSRSMVLEFLQTLVLFPPDDTASNLNPGDPASQDPQNPANHGNINLGALFQIPGEGPE